jgi:hypothetical protein
MSAKKRGYGFASQLLQQLLDTGCVRCSSKMVVGMAQVMWNHRISDLGRFIVSPVCRDVHLPFDKQFHQASAAILFHCVVTFNSLTMASKAAGFTTLGLTSERQSLVTTLFACESGP